VGDKVVWSVAAVVAVRRVACGADRGVGGRDDSVLQDVNRKRIPKNNIKNFFIQFL
jgi:hypothetical protein